MNGTPVPQQPQAEEEDVVAQDEDAAFIEGERGAAQRNVARDQVIHNVALARAIAASRAANVGLGRVDRASPNFSRFKTFLFLVTMVAFITSLVCLKFTIVPFVVSLAVLILLLIKHYCFDRRRELELAVLADRQHMRLPLLREVE